jgi:glycosyltransferase involved in cell wall biosynthesis
MTSPGLSSENPPATPDERPFVSVIVPVKDGLELLRQCVEALLDQDYPADRYQVLIVDNGSAVSPEGQLPSDPRVTVLSEPTPGSYRARNAALAVATGEILAFTDADCRPAPDWVSQAVRYLVDHPEVDMIGGQVKLSYSAGRPLNGAEWYEFDSGFPQEQYVHNGYAVTANMVTRRSVFDRVGLFDADLMSGGDGEWGRRVRAAGGVQKYVAEALVTHPARDTWAEVRKKTVRTTEGVVRRKLRAPHPRRALLRLLLGQLFRSLVLPVRVARNRKLPSLPARFSFLLTRWRVDLVIVGMLVRNLLRSRM